VNHKGSFQVIACFKARPQFSGDTIINGEKPREGF